MPSMESPPAVIMGAVVFVVIGISLMVAALKRLVTTEVINSSFVETNSHIII